MVGEHDQGIRDRVQDSEGDGAVGRFEDIVALVFEEDAQRRANLFVVVDDQDALPNARRVSKLLHSLLHETPLQCPTNGVHHGQPHRLWRRQSAVQEWCR